MQHHVTLPADAMGKITYIAPPGQYSLKVCLLCHVILVISSNASQQSRLFLYNICFDFVDEIR